MFRKNFTNMFRKMVIRERQVSFAGHRSQVAGRRSQVAGHRSQVAGHRLQVTGHRSQVTGCRSHQNKKAISNTGDTRVTRDSQEVS